MEDWNTLVEDKYMTAWGKLACLSNDLLCTISSDGKFLHVNSNSKCILGYASEEMIGQPCTEFLHPHDCAITKQAFGKLESGERLMGFRNRFVGKGGTSVHLQWSAIGSAEDGCIYALGQDITELVLGKRKLEESEQRYRLLFEHNKDLILLENVEGLVSEANQSFCDAFSVPKSVALNARASSFMTPDLASVAEASLQAALAGSIMRSDVTLKTSSGEVKVFDAVKYPIKVNGETMGVQTVARDITPMVRAYETSQKQAKKLNTILESITDGFLTINRNWQITYFNKEAKNLFSFKKSRHIGKSLWEAFPGEQSGDFCKNCQHALDTGETMNFTTLLKEHGKWFKVKAYPSEEGLSIYFDDITVQIEAQQEVEKLSLVASRTVHGVIIADANGLTEWVNEGFANLTGYTLAELKGKKPGDLLQGKETDPETVRYMSEMLKKQVPFNTNLINYKKSGKRVWFAMDITPVFDQSGKLTRYIAIQKDITERVKARQEIERLSLVASNTTNGVIIANAEGKIEYVNKGFTAMTGYDFEEAVGHEPHELLRHERADQETYRKVEERLKPEEPISFEVLNKRKDGSDLWVSVQKNPLIGEKGEIQGYISIQSDITERVRSRMELQKLSLVASKTNNGVLIADSDWKIEWVNEGFTRLFGYELEEAVGKKPPQLLHSLTTDRNKFRAQEEKLLSGEPISFEVLNVKKDGQEVWVSIEISPVQDQHGRITRFVEVQTDITALKTSELELSQLAEDLHRKNNDLQQFTYIVSHVLRQHGANIMGLTDMLLNQDSSSGAYKRTMAFLRQSAYKLDDVLRDMNTILTIRDSGGNLEMGQVNVCEVFSEALAVFQERLQCRSSSVSLDLPENVTVKASRAYLYNIFHQLLSNAIKFQAPDRSLQISLKCVGVTASGVLLRFSDNGLGFDSRKEAKNLFKLYKRFHTQPEGRGMGLYQVRNQVEAMGGRIDVTSQEGKGTDFLLYLH